MMTRTAATIGIYGCLTAFVCALSPGVCAADTLKKKFDLNADAGYAYFIGQTSQSSPSFGFRMNYWLTHHVALGFSVPFHMNHKGELVGAKWSISEDAEPIMCRERNDCRERALGIIPHFSVGEIWGSFVPYFSMGMGAYLVMSSAEITPNNPQTDMTPRYAVLVGLGMKYRFLKIFTADLGVRYTHLIQDEQIPKLVTPYLSVGSLF